MIKSAREFDGNGLSAGEYAPPSNGDGAMRIRQAGKKATRTGTMTFGAVTIDRVKLSKEERSQNAARNTSVLTGLTQALRKPGVKIRPVKGVPMFHAHPSEPGRLIRVLDGKTETVVFEDGAFKVVM